MSASAPRSNSIRQHSVINDPDGADGDSDVQRIATQDYQALGRPSRNSSENNCAVVEMDILAKRDSDGNLLPPRSYTDTTRVTVGEAAVNDLDFVSAFFGGDALSPGAGVYINQLPSIDRSGLRVSNDLIANGISNVAAHEIGHVLGLVPNSNSQSLASQNGDNRFAGVGFDGSNTDPKHHASAGIMQAVLIGQTLQGDPTILGSGLFFRPNDTTYLAATLPR